MANWPTDVTLCELIIDDGLSSTGIEIDTYVTVSLVLQGTDRLVWNDGTEFLPLPDRMRNPVSILVPVTDQEWRDGSGNTYTGFAYEVTVTRQRITDRNTYTVPVQPITGQTSIVISELTDGTIGEPVIVPNLGVGREYPFTNAATWTLTHTLGRRPSVSMYATDGTPFESDYTATSTQVVATHPAPISGSLVLI
jgi:hypothetical protein